LGKPEGKRSLENLDVGGSIILKWIIEKYDGVWPGFIWIRTGTVEGFYEYGNEP
jgi:hypothetical protein